MKRQRHPRTARRQPPGKFTIDEMNGDAPCTEAQGAVDLQFALHRQRHIAILDNDDLAGLLAKMADFFFGIRFAHHLARHFCPSAEVKTDKRRIETTDEGVIDLKITDRIDPLGLHEI